MAEPLRIGSTAMFIRTIRQYWWQRFEQRDSCSAADLIDFRGLNPEAQRRLLAARLFAQIRYFGNREDALPEWREAARINDPDELWRVWPSLPILTKKALRDYFDADATKSRFGIDGMVRATGGSTGEPTRVLHDGGMLRATKAASTYTRIRMGWKPGMATVVVWGSERDIGRKQDLRNRLYTQLMGDYVVDGYGLTRETVRTVLSLVHQHRPAALM